MILQGGLLLLFLGVVSCKESTNYIGVNTNISTVDRRYSFWPSLHNGARVMRLRKREAQSQRGVIGQSDGGIVEDSSYKEANLTATEKPIAPQPGNQPEVSQEDSHAVIPIMPVVAAPIGEKSSPVQNPKTANDDIVVKKEPKATTTQTVVTENDRPTNHTLEATPSPLDLNNPGVIKRGIIVFGGFLLLAVAYFIFYRRKSNKNEAGNPENTANTNQFRYGVLQSEDRRDNMELSRIPLTMESDEEDDEDLEIFDLEQKKKSLSYINLETNDEDIVFDNSREGQSNRDNLLLDIEDGPSDTLINWSNNGNKSIL